MSHRKITLIPNNSPQSPQSRPNPSQNLDDNHPTNYRNSYRNRNKNRPRRRDERNKRDPEEIPNKDENKQHNTHQENHGPSESRFPLSIDNPCDGDAKDQQGENPSLSGSQGNQSQNRHKRRYQEQEDTEENQRTEEDEEERAELPPGWKEVVHSLTNLSFWIHQPTRVCVWSRPYVCPSQYERNHEPPLSSFHSLLQIRPKKRRRFSSNISSTQSSHLITSALGVNPNHTHPFDQKKDLRKFRKRRTEGPKSELTPDGKTPISFLQEYCVNVLKTTPEYQSIIQEDPSSPFVTVVKINGKKYGEAAFLNKKQSKQMAAQATLEILSPGLYHPSSTALSSSDSALSALTEDSASLLNNNDYGDDSFDDLNNNNHHTHKIDTSSTLHDIKDIGASNEVLIDDEIIIENLSSNTKTPAQILQEYCNRTQTQVYWNYEPIDLVPPNTTNTNATALTAGRDRAFKVEASLNGFTAQAQGKNKKAAKQRVAQLLLAQIHPQLRTWSRLLEFYAQRKEDEEEPIDLNPTFPLLEKLKAQMRQFCGLSDEQKELKTIETELIAASKEQEMKENQIDEQYDQALDRDQKIKEMVRMLRERKNRFQTNKPPEPPPQLSTTPTTTTKTGLDPLTDREQTTSTPTRPTPSSSSTSAPSLHSSNSLTSPSVGN